MFQSRNPESVYSEANLFTLVRVTACMICFSTAILYRNPYYNYLGFFIHWLGDFVDGFIARRFRQETLIGAEIDIIADRLELIVFYVVFLHFRPSLVLPAMLYLFDYAFVDCYLSYQFVKYDIISPNYFYKVDRRIYLLNYSPLGKFSNSSIVTLTLIFFPRFHLWVTLYTCGLIGVKTYSVIRLFRLRRQGGRNA